MNTFLVVLYVLVCLFLILVVLLQSGKGGGMGSAFGGAGGAGQQVFGGAGAGNILTRITSVSAALFMILSAVLAYQSSHGQHSLLQQRARQEESQEGAAITPPTPEEVGEAPSGTSTTPAPASTAAPQGASSEESGAAAAGPTSAAPVSEGVAGEAAPSPEANTAEPAPGQ